MKKASLQCLLGLLGLIAVLSTTGPAAAQQPVTVRIPVLPEFARHVEMARHPAYLALALENVGAVPSYSNRMVIRDRTALAIGPASVRFVGMKGDILQYEAQLDLGRLGGGASITVPVEADVGSIKDGHVVVRGYPPLSGLVPDEMMAKVEFKIRALANATVQKSLIDYLDERGRRSATGLDGVLEAILIEAYNRGPPVGADRPDTGDAVPLIEQAALLATIVIWFVMVPLVLWLRRWRSSRRHRTVA